MSATRPHDPGPAELLEAARKARHVRIVLLTGLGDVVHGLPIANAIRRARPDCRISWVVEPMPAGLLQHHPAIDQVIVFHKKAGLRGVRELRNALAAKHPRRAQPTTRPDITLNLNIYFKSVFPTVLERAPVRIGFDRARARDGVWLFCTHQLHARPRAHTQDMFLEFLELLAIPADPLEWRLQPTPAEEQERNAFFHQHLSPGERAAGIVTASANPKKDWPAERYVQLADRIHHDFGLRPVLLGGPGRRESAAAAHIQRHANAPVINALADGVRTLAWRIQHCDLLIAPDTGPVHIARALDVPVIGLYGHSNPWRVGPWRRYHDLWVDRYTDGEPDPSNFEPKLGRMERITVADVTGRVAHALARYPRPGRPARL